MMKRERINSQQKSKGGSMVIELKVAVIKSNKSQMQIARDTGVDPSTLSRILNGWITPDEETIVKLATSVGLSPKALHNAFKRNKQGEKHGE